MEEQMAEVKTQEATPEVATISAAATAASATKPKKGLTQLSPNFVPTNYSVILGRGKGAYNYVGNKRCRVIVKSFLGEYNKCNTRQERSVQVTKVLEIIREACPIGAFVKNENGSWYSVDEKIAREKIFTMFRDCQNSQARRSSSSSLRSSLRSTSSSPHKMTASPSVQVSFPEPQPVVSENLKKPLTSISASREEPAVDHLPPPADIFEPIMFDDEDSLGESLGSNCGSFYDIDSCSLCTI
eukprot:Sro100_g051130.1 n/a (242) ;mRNA; r:13136-13861